MDKIGKEGAKSIHEDCKRALDIVGRKYNLEVTARNARYSNNEMTVRFVFRTKTTDADGNRVTPEANAFKAQAWLHGLKPEDLGKVFKSGDKTFKITGLVPRRRKYPIQATCVENGKGYKFGANQVVAALAESN